MYKRQVVHVLECAVGLMIGTELVWNKIKRSGKSIVITTLTQSLGTFFVVSLVFGVVFYLSDILDVYKRQDQEELALAEWFEREEIPVTERNISLTNEMILAFKNSII